MPIDLRAIGEITKSANCKPMILSAFLRIAKFSIEFFMRVDLINLVPWILTSSQASSSSLSSLPPRASLMITPLSLFDNSNINLSIRTLRLNK